LMGRSSRGSPSRRRTSAPSWSPERQSPWDHAYRGKNDIGSDGQSTCHGEQPSGRPAIWTGYQTANIRRIRCPGYETDTSLRGGQHQDFQREADCTGLSPGSQDGITKRVRRTGPPDLPERRGPRMEATGAQRCQGRQRVAQCDPRPQP
jgi:hypothetical protein